MTADRTENDKKNARHHVRVDSENQGEPLTIEEVRRRISDLGLATPSEAETMVREDRDSR